MRGIASNGLVSFSESLCINGLPRLLPRVEIRLRILLLASLFSAFVVSSVMLLSLDPQRMPVPGWKTERLAELIVSACADNLAHYDMPSLTRSMESFFANRDIVSMRVTDSAGNKVVSLARPMGRMEKLPVTRSIEKNGQILGTLSLILTNFEERELAHRISGLIVEANMENIWDYNIEALNNSIESFLKGDNIRRIVIRETSGFVLLDREQGARDVATLTVKKDIRREGWIIGTIEIDFFSFKSDASVSMISGNARPVVMAALTVALAVCMTIAFIFLKKSGEAAPSSLADLDGSRASPTTHWTVSSSIEEKLNKAVEYIENNYNRTISREGLAVMLELNADNLGRYFKLYMGEKINDRVNRLRVDEAGRKLASTKDTIVSIAFDVGFENICTFNRAFWKIMGVTPTEYRKKTLHGG
ncbi:MAG: AraC family transcriptional regulator [Spirochaetes bacterium]|nr:MAG: AraC family transcriptional regulator [Spirochaetota bacterium]